MKTAQLFVSGGNQAVRLPDGYQFKGEDVYIHKVGDALLLSPIGKEWETFLHGLNGFSQDFFADGRSQGANQERDEL